MLLRIVIVITLFVSCSRKQILLDGIYISNKQYYTIIVKGNRVSIYSIIEDSKYVSNDIFIYCLNCRNKESKIELYQKNDKEIVIVANDANANLDFVFIKAKEFLDEIDSIFLSNSNGNKIFRVGKDLSISPLNSNLSISMSPIDEIAFYSDSTLIEKSRKLANVNYDLVVKFKSGVKIRKKIYNVETYTPIIRNMANELKTKSSKKIVRDKQ